MDALLEKAKIVELVFLFSSLENFPEAHPTAQFIRQAWNRLVHANNAVARYVETKLRGSMRSEGPDTNLPCGEAVEVRRSFFFFDCNTVQTSFELKHERFF